MDPEFPLPVPQEIRSTTAAAREVNPKPLTGSLTKPPARRLGGTTPSSARRASTSRRQLDVDVPPSQVRLH